MNNDYSYLLEILHDDNLTNQFISNFPAKDRNTMINVVNFEMSNILNGNKSKIMYIDTVCRIIQIYDECYSNLLIKDEFIVLDPNLKLLKQYYDYLKKREDVFKDIPQLISDKEEQVKKLIKNLFEKIKYNDNFKKIISKYDINVYYKKMLSFNDFNLFSNLLMNNCFDNIPDSYINYYMYLIINFDYPIKIDALKVVITNLIINILKEYGKKYKVKFKDMDCCGTHYDNIICINNKLLEDFNGDVSQKCDLLLTIFHEIRHAIQDISIKNSSYTNYMVIKMIKDTLLSEYMYNIEYDINYPKLKIEYDAYDMELIYVYRYLKLIKVDKKTLELIKTKIKTNKFFNSFNNTDNRVMDYKLLPLDIIFDIYIKDIIEFYKNEYQEDIFEIYPQLKYIYNIDGTRKNIIQLLEEQDNVKDNDKWIYNDIILNQTLSYLEIIDLFKEININSKYKTIILSLFKNRIKSSLRISIDVYDFIKCNITINIQNIVDRYKKLLKILENNEQEVKHGR